jgi:cullin-associated NEDD8-dissociated protein 1
MSFDINNILKNFDDADKDLRYIALSDLGSEIPKETFKFEGANESKVVDGMIKLLYDVANEVQAQAIVVLTPLLRKISNENIKRICSALAEYTTNEKKAEKSKETCSSGLKVIVNNVGDDLAQTISDLLGPPLVSGIKNQDEEIASDCLDITKDLMRRWGSNMGGHRQLLLEATIPQLSNSRNIIQNRAVGCLGALAPFIPVEDFDKTINILISSLEKGGKDKPIFIQALGTLGYYAGPKLGKHVERISPLLISAVNETKEGDEESKESAFRTFEAFLQSCRDNVGENFENILNLAIKFVKFDPLVEEDEEEEEEEEGGEEDEEDEEDDEDDEEEEEEEDEAAGEDKAWKIRSASAKVLGAAVSSTPSKLKELSLQVVPILINRLSEREHVVRHEIFSVLISIIKQLGSYQLKDVVEQWVSKIVNQVKGSISSKIEQTKLDAVTLLRTVLQIVPNAYSPFMKSLIPTIAKGCSDNANAKMQIAAFIFVRILVSSHKSDTFLAYLSRLAKAITVGTTSKNALVAVAAARSGAAIAQNIPVDAKESIEAVVSIFKSLSAPFEEKIYDSNVKEAAINTVAHILSRFGEKVGDVNKILKNLVGKLGEETTREASAHAFTIITSSTLQINLTPVLGDLVKELSACLRQSSRAITSDSLTVLSHILQKYASAKELKSVYSNIVQDASKLVNPKDVYQSGLAVGLVAKVVFAEPKTASDVQTHLYPNIESVLREAVVDGNEGQAFGSLHAALSKADTKKFGFSELEKSLSQLANDSRVKENKLYDGIGICLASLITNTSESNTKKSISTYVSNIKSNKDEPTTLLSLAVIGHIGRQIDISPHGDVQQTIAGLLTSTSQDIIAAAGRALGDIAVGNVEKFLPFILENSKDPSKQYSILNAMRQLVIGKSQTSEGINDLSKHLDKITPVLFAAKPKDAAGQNLVAECLGRAATVAPSKIIPELHKRLSEEDVSTRATAVNSLSYIKYDSQNATNIYENLKNVISDFIQLIGDKELIVRDCAINGLSFVITRNLSLVRSVLPSHMDSVLAQAERCEFREIDYGTHKEYADNTLKGREVIFTNIFPHLFNECPELVDPNKMIKAVLAVFRHDAKLRPQTDDIMVQANLILVNLCSLAPTVVLSSLIDCVGPLEIEIKKNAETNVKRSTLQAIAAICKIPNWENANPKFTEVVNKLVKGNDKLKQRYEQLLASKVVLSTL